MEQSQKRLLIIFFLSLLVFRMSLISVGHFDRQDELRYRYSLAFLREARDGHIVEAVKQMYQFHLYGRPGLVLAHLPQAFIQGVLLVLTGIKTETPPSLSVASFINVMVTLLVSAVFFLIARKFLKDFYLSFYATVVYSFLVKTNIHIRHILPYDISLLGYLLLMYKVVGEKRARFSKLKVIVLGAGSGVVHSIYPGYYAFVIILLLLIWNQRKKLFESSLMYAGGFTLIYSLFILLGFIVGMGQELISSIVQVASTQIQGVFSEGYVFWLKYLLEAEPIVGIALIVLLGIFFLQIMFQPRRFVDKRTKIILAAVLLYLFHATTTVLQLTVFYGRTLGIYIPFIVLASFLAIQRLPKLKTLLGTGLMVTTLLGIMIWYPEYQDLAYPRDVKYQICDSIYSCPANIAFVEENIERPMDYLFPKEITHILVNFSPLYPVYDPLISFVPPPAAKLIYKKPYARSFRGYLFEGYGKEERQRLKTSDYSVAVYQLN